VDRLDRNKLIEVNACGLCKLTPIDAHGGLWYSMKTCQILKVLLGYIVSMHA